MSCFAVRVGASSIQPAGNSRHRFRRGSILMPASDAHRSSVGGDVLYFRHSWRTDTSSAAASWAKVVGAGRLLAGGFLAIVRLMPRRCR
jgi:hypothetical protein